MKKKMMFLPVVILFVAVLNCRSADAWSLSGLDKIHSAFVNAGYHISMAECKAELADLEDRIEIMSSVYQEEARRQYDLRRQLNDCWRDREDIIINLDECREMNGEASDGEGYGSASVEGSENRGDLGFGIDRMLVVRVVDFMVDGTCEEPKTDRRREECLSGCRALAEWLREELVWATWRADHVEESMREDIAYCQLELGSLQNELTICESGGDVSDAGAPAITTEGDDTCTVDPEGNAFCSADPSDSPPAADSDDLLYDSDNEATGGDQEQSFMERVIKLTHQAID